MALLTFQGTPLPDGLLSTCSVSNRRFFGFVTSRQYSSSIYDFAGSGSAIINAVPNEASRTRTFLETLLQSSNNTRSPRKQKIPSFAHVLIRLVGRLPSLHGRPLPTGIKLGHYRPTPLLHKRHDPSGDRNRWRWEYLHESSSDTEGPDLDIDLVDDESVDFPPLYLDADDWVRSVEGLSTGNDGIHTYPTEDHDLGSLESSDAESGMSSETEGSLSYVKPKWVDHMSYEEWLSSAYHGLPPLDEESNEPRAMGEGTSGSGQTGESDILQQSKEPIA